MNHFIPNIEFKKPNAFPVFEVRIVYAEHLKNYWIVWLLSLLFVPLLFAPDENRFMAAFALLFFISIGIFVKRRYKRALKEPVVMQAYKDGLWFNWDEVFVPYERLLDIAIKRRSVGSGIGASMRRIIFRLHTDETSARQIKQKNPWLKIDGLLWPKGIIELTLPGQDGIMSPSFEEIIAQIQKILSSRIN